MTTIINISDEALSDVSLSGRRSYIQLSPVDFDSYKFIIEFELRPLNDRGLILFIGKLEGSSFLSVSMQGAGLEIRVYLGTKILHFVVDTVMYNCWVLICRTT